MDLNGCSFDNASFNAVWQRVTGGDCNTSDIGRYAGPDSISELQSFIDGESQDVKLYATLAAMCPGSFRTAVLRLASEERSYLKRLRAQYFILTGKTYLPADACPLVYSLADTLRLKYAAELDAAAAYTAAAETVPRPDLSDTYHDLSAGKTRHARTLCCLIEELF